MAGKTAKKEPIDAADEIPALESLIGYNLKRAYVVVYEDYRATLGQDGFAPRVFSALALVVQFPNITQSAVARHLGIERSGLVAIVDELEKRKLILRTPVPGDRRVQALVPTEAGKAAFAQAQKDVTAHEDRLLSNLSDAEKQTLTRLLKKIRNAEGS